MTTTVSITRTVASAPPHVSQRVLEIAGMFGLGVDEQREITIVPPTQVPVPKCGIIFITGPSGSGKSTILNLMAEQLSPQSHVIRLSDLPPAPDLPLIDAIGSTLEDATNLLAIVG